MEWLKQIGLRRSETDPARGAVTVYRRPDAYYVVTSAHTTMGLWCIRSPAEIVDRSAESEDLGQVVLDAVSLPAQIVPHPKQHEWTEHTREALHPLQRQARVRSWKAFLLPADDVHVHRTESEIRVVPYVQDPSRKHPGTRMPVVEREVLLVRPDARSLGDALFTAFDR